MSAKFIDSLLYSFEDSMIEKAMGGHFPNGASLQSLRHFSQITKKGKFTLIDHGRRKNIEEYGQIEPPFIDIKEIKDVPIALFVGYHDMIANINDNRWLEQELGSNCVFYQEFPASHASFLTGRDMSYFDRVIQLTLYYNKIEH